MSMRILATAALLAASTSLAIAQQAAPEQPEDMSDQAMPEVRSPSPDRQMGMKGMGMRDMGRGDMGNRHFGWHHMRHHEGKGFTLRLGRGNRLNVECGDESLKSCIDAARPLIDRLAGDTGTQPPVEGTTGAIQPPQPAEPPTAPADDLRYHETSPASPSDAEE